MHTGGQDRYLSCPNGTLQPSKFAQTNNKQKLPVTCAISEKRSVRAMGVLRHLPEIKKDE